MHIERDQHISLCNSHKASIKNDYLQATGKEDSTDKRNSIMNVTETLLLCIIDAYLSSGFSLDHSVSDGSFKRTLNDSLHIVVLTSNSIRANITTWCIIE